MANEDALVLSLELAAHGSMEAKLQRFLAQRFERCKSISEQPVLAGRHEMARYQSFDRIGLTKQMLNLMPEPI